MSQESWRNVENPNETDCCDVQETDLVADGSEETIFDYEDVRDYDLGEGD
jgi:hypothetical protein